jgi:hypothetical protein
MDEQDDIEDMQVQARRNWEKRVRRIGLISKENKSESTGEKPNL